MLTVITPASSSQLCAVADLQAEVSGLSDGRAGALIDQASAALASYCRRVFGSEDVSEQFRLAERDRNRPLLLARTPVTALTSVVEDGVTLDASDYEVDKPTGRLYRLVDDERAPWAAAKIVVTYTAGWSLPSSAPKDLSRAALTLAAAIHAASTRDAAIRSESVDGVSAVSYFDPANGGGALPEAVRTLADPYRNLKV